jgi:uncharacterized protein YggT (Ycf19 family)
VEAEMPVILNTWSITMQKKCCVLLVVWCMLFAVCCVLQQNEQTIHQLVAELMGPWI